MKKWTVTITEKNDTEAYETTFIVHANNMLEAAKFATIRCNDNYDNMYVSVIEEAY